MARDESSLDLARIAVDKLVAEHPAAGNVDAILFCTQTPEQMMPPNATLLHEHMNLDEHVFALDFTLACSGFVYGLAQAHALLTAALATSVLLVTADTYSRIINPDDRAPRVLFGDGAAATWIIPGDRGLVDVSLATSGREHRAFMVPRGSTTIKMDGLRVLGFVESRVPKQILGLLNRNGLSIGDIDLFIFHQASRLALDTLAGRLGLPAERMYSNIDRVGNTVSASIPIALRDAMDEGVLKAGDRTVLCGFGVGMSWATAIMDI